MKVVLGQLELENRLSIFMDDIIVQGDSFDSLLDNLCHTMAQLYRYDLRLNVDKFVGPTTCVEFVGVEIDGREGGAVRPARKHVTAIATLPQPSNHLELYKFVGLASFLRQFARTPAQ